MRSIGKRRSDCRPAVSKASGVRINHIGTDPGLHLPVTGLMRFRCAPGLRLAKTRTGSTREVGLAHRRPYDSFRMNATEISCARMPSAVAIYRKITISSREARQATAPHPAPSTRGPRRRRRLRRAMTYGPDAHTCLLSSGCFRGRGAAGSPGAGHRPGSTTKRWSA